MNSETILYSLIGVIATSVITYLFTRWGNRAKYDDEELAQVVKDMEQLKVLAVSEHRVRDIIKEHVETTSQDVKDIKRSIHDLRDIVQNVQLKLAEEMAYKRGKQEREEGHKN